MKSFFPAWTFFRGTCSYLHVVIGLGTVVKLEMLPTLELSFKYYFKLWSVFWNLQVEQFILIHQQKPWDVSEMS